MNYKYIIDINEFVFLMWIIFLSILISNMCCSSLFQHKLLQPKWHKAKQNVLNMRDPRMGQQDEIEV